MIKKTKGLKLLFGAVLIVGLSLLSLIIAVAIDNKINTPNIDQKKAEEVEKLFQRLVAVRYDQRQIIQCMQEIVKNKGNTLLSDVDFFLNKSDGDVSFIAAACWYNRYKDMCYCIILSRDGEINVLEKKIKKQRD